MQRPEIEAWQRYLRDRGFYHGRISGEFDWETRVGITNYQNSAQLKADGIIGTATTEHARRDGFSPPIGASQPYETVGGVVLSMQSRDVLRRLAVEYYRETGVKLTVTSGTRAPREQAEAMYEKLRHGADLRKLYKIEKPSMRF